MDKINRNYWAIRE